jgi:hypothetical protein
VHVGTPKWGCVDTSEAYALPHRWLAANKQHLNMTERGRAVVSATIALTTIERGKLAINVLRLGSKVPLDPFRFRFCRAADELAGKQSAMPNTMPTRCVAGRISFGNSAADIASKRKAHKQFGSTRHFVVKLAIYCVSARLRTHNPLIEDSNPSGPTYAA